MTHGDGIVTGRVHRSLTTLAQELAFSPLETLAVREEVETQLGPRGPSTG
jgi:hypothetical protein